MLRHTSNISPPQAATEEFCCAHSTRLDEVSTLLVSGGSLGAGEQGPGGEGEGQEQEEEQEDDGGDPAARIRWGWTGRRDCVPRLGSWRLAGMCPLPEGPCVERYLLDLTARSLFPA